MAGPQSGIQQNIQNAVGTQTLAQNNTPFTANNGNPNIVYNQPGVGAGYIPPMFGDDGIWRVNSTAPAAPFDYSDVSTVSGVPTITLPTQPVTPAPRPTPTPVPTPTPTPKPTVTYQPITEWVRNVNGVPQRNDGLYNSDPAYKRAWDRATAEHQAQFGKGYTRDSSFEIIQSALQRYYNEYGGKGIPSSGGNPFGGPPTTGKPVAQLNLGGTGWSGQYENPLVADPKFNNLWGDGASYPQSFTKMGITRNDLANPQVIPKQAIDNLPANSPVRDLLSGSVDALRNKLGVEQGKDFSILQFLDIVSEPFLPGNLYNSDTDKVNTANVVKSLLTKVIPGIGPLIFLFGMVNKGVQKLLDKGDTEGAVQAMIKEGGLDAPVSVGRGGGGGGGNPFESNGGGGCVVVTSKVPGFDDAGGIKVGDLMLVIDAKTFELGKAEVTYAKSELQPCVLITTESGIQLECSTTAPIADKDGNQVKAPDLLGVEVPVVDKGEQRFEKVVSVEHTGVKSVQKITCGNQFFLAGKESGRYLLHHNVKDDGFWSNRSFNHNAPAYGTVGPIENIK